MSAPTGRDLEALASLAGVEPGDLQDEAVLARLRLRGDTPIGSLFNVHTVLAEDRRWSNRITRDDFSRQVLIDGRTIEDATIPEIRLWLEKVYGLRAVGTTVEEAVRLVASAHVNHPLRDRLRACTWDRMPRLERVFTDCFGAADTPLHAALGVRWFIGAVARAFLPGCKLDTMLVLCGAQGTFKSTSLELLALDARWHCATPPDWRTKDAELGHLGTWIWEVQELAGMGRAGLHRIKSHLSTATDRYRPPYGRHLVAVPRQSVLVGTTNETNFLEDPTGERRFWPVETGRIAVDALRDLREQLWGEALARFERGEQWYLTGEETLWLVAAHQRCSRVDPWLEKIAAWADGQEGFTMAVLLGEVLGLSAVQMSRAAQNRAGRCLGQLQFRRVMNRRSDPEGGPSVRAWRWYRGVADPDGVDGDGGDRGDGGS